MFTIDDNAAIEIRRILEKSNYEDVVASLGEEAESGALSNEINEYIWDNDGDHLRLNNDLIQKVEALNFVLSVNAFQREQCPPEALLIEIKDITFSFTPYIYEVLSDYCLTFKDRSFYLEGKEEIVSNIRSLSIFNPKS